MLSILEKLQYGLSALVILGALTLYLWQGVETREVRDIQGARKQPSPPTVKQEAVPGGLRQPPARSQPPAADRAILDRLRLEQNVPGLAGKDLTHEKYDVDKETVEFIGREANWAPELKKAKSQLLPGKDGRNTRLKVFDIDENSLFKKLGLVDGDIIEFIDDERIDFDGSSYTDHIGRWNKIKQKLESGKPIALTVTRGGRPVQAEFKLKP